MRNDESLSILSLRACYGQLMMIEVDEVETKLLPNPELSRVGDGLEDVLISLSAERDVAQLRRPI